ncbi:MAG TPA: hypothetical protein VIS31_06455 [Woeseiaceae bacterium]
MKHNYFVPALLAASALWLSACSTSETRTEAQFGDAVRSVTRGQIHDPGAALSPQKEAVTGADPAVLERVLLEHRTGEGGNAAAVGQPVTISVGGESRN